MIRLQRGRATDLKCGVRAYYQESGIYRMGFVAFFGVKDKNQLRDAFVETLGAKHWALELERGFPFGTPDNGCLMWNQNGVLETKVAPKWLTWVHTAFFAFNFHQVDSADAVNAIAHEASHLVDSIGSWIDAGGTESLLRGEPRAYLTGWIAEELAYGANVKTNKRRKRRSK